MKKGFTLAEMLGVIAILAILGLLVFPIVDKSIKEGKDEIYKVQISNIESGAIEWVADNIFKSPESDNEEMLLSLYQLKKSGKVDNEILNPVNKKLFPDDMIIKITKTKSDYKAKVLENSIGESNLTKYSELTPSLKLNGDELVYLEYVKNSSDTYTDSGVVALSSEGLTLTPTTIIKDSLGNEVSSISYGLIGTYNIYYDLEDNDIKVRVIRTVIVKDSKAPVITIPSTTRVSRSNAASYNLTNTVTVTDQSDYVLTLDRTNLPSVAGTYTITYTATDIYNNTSTARRTIIVE